MAPRLKFPATHARKPAQQERSRATVEQILAAAARVLVTVGYDRASTKRIAAEAGVSIGSLYQYFPSKEAVVAALIDAHVATLFRVLEGEVAQLLERALPLAEAARRLVTAYFRAQEVDQPLRRVFLEQVPRVGQLNRLSEIEARAVKMVAAFLRRRPDDLTVRVLVRTVQQLTYAALVDPAGHDESAWIHEVTRLVLRYLEESR